jgi:small subunit ribosomal protein S6
MSKYEVMFIVRPTMAEEAQAELVKSMEEIFTSRGAVIEETIDWGKRELAYEIADFKQGHYFIFNVESTNEANLEFDRVARINEDIVRSIIIKK